MFEPLKITARLQTAVIADAGVPLDAVLLYHAVREKFGPQTVTVTDDIFPDTTIPVRLPFAIHNEGRPDWFYAVSFGEWSQPVANGTDHWNKRFRQEYADLVDFGKRKAKVDTAQGAYKPYHMPVFYRHALSLTWHALADKEELARLLRHCTHLGKKTSQGFGSVLEWKIEPIAEDLTCFRDGQPARPIPVAEGPVFGIRPPYRLAKNQFPCLLPDLS